MQALHIPILSPSIVRPIWNYCSLQQLYVFIYLAYSILLNFLIHSQLTAEMGRGIAVVKIGVNIGSRAGIGVSSSKNISRLSRVPLLLYKTSSIVYSGGVGK